MAITITRTIDENSDQPLDEESYWANVNDMLRRAHAAYGAAGSLFPVDVYFSVPGFHVPPIILYPAKPFADLPMPTPTPKEPT